MSQTQVSNNNEKNVTGSPRVAEAETPDYPPTSRRLIIMVAMYLGIFLVNLDQNIISTAIPRITNEFHSLDDIAWYGSAYLLTTCTFQLLMGKVYKYYPVKPVFLLCCTVFEIGSVICGAAPNSIVFILGRAIAGTGASGIFSGVMMVIFHIVPREQRPKYQGFFAAIFAVASVIGPLIGGTFTDKLTWRWCFYINLPIGAIAMVVTFFILHLPNQKPDTRAQGWWAHLQQFDPIGVLVIFPAIVCLILALQWGGVKYSWNDARIIILLVIFGILVIAFIGIQVWKQEKATIPPRLLKQRSMVAAVWYMFFSGAGIIVLMYYLPLWFQAVKGVSAVESGVMLLPLMLSTVVGSISSGFATSKLGYYNPFFIFGSVTMAIGAGLMATFTPQTGPPKWIGAQVVFGLGFGVGIPLPMAVVQTVLGKSDMSTGIAFIMFMRLLGSTIFLSVAQPIFLDGLVSKLTSNLSDISQSTVVDSGATDLRNVASGADLVTLLADYNDALVDVFYLVIAVCAVTVFGSVAVEWRSLKTQADSQDPAGKRPGQVTKA